MPIDWKAHLAQSKDFEERFFAKLPKTDDLTLIVLKGHLLIEELVNFTINGLLPNPAALKSAQLDCYQRIRLLMALIPDHGDYISPKIFQPCVQRSPVQPSFVNIIAFLNRNLDAAEKGNL